MHGPRRRARTIKSRHLFNREKNQRILGLKIKINNGSVPGLV
jgi:hypothetical protein